MGTKNKTVAAEDEQLRRWIAEDDGRFKTMSEDPANRHKEDSANRHKDWIPIVDKDIEKLIDKNIEYQDSWKRRGGIGAFMMLARKWDRIEAYLERKDRRYSQYDIFEGALEDTRQEGLLDDIQDLRRYLILIEAEIHELSKDPGS